MLQIFLQGIEAFVVRLQLLSLIDRSRFARLVRATGSERRTKGFASWDHFVAMLFCQLAQARSLREIDAGLSSCEGSRQTPFSSRS